MELNTIAFIGIMALMASCSGQNTSSLSISSDTAQGSNAALGDTVQSLGKSIWIIFQDTNGHYWFGSDGQGAYRYDGKTLLNFSKKQGLPSNRIRGIQEDKSGNIFISTLDGISKYDGQSFSPLLIVESNDWNSNHDDLWFTILGKAKDNGPYRFDGKALHHLKLPKSSLEDDYYANSPNQSFSPYDVYSVYRDRKGYLWFGTSNFGLCRFDGNTHNWLYEDHWTNTPEGGSFGIRAMIEDQEGNFWFCNTKYRYDIRTRDSIENENLLVDYVQEPGIPNLEAPNGKDEIYFMSVIEDDNGDIWMATYNQGVWKYDGTKATRYSVVDSSIETTLFSIYKDRLGELWLGTQDSGAFKFNGKAFEKFKP